METLLIHDLTPKQLSAVLPDTSGYTIIDANRSAAFCQGCFRCWLASPGRCVMKDSLLDGQIISDSAPFEPETESAPVPLTQKKTSMSFFTALGLSLNNLLTKKGRTILTAFAGSIGIIGIALILSLSTGIQD